LGYFIIMVVLIELGYSQKLTSLIIQIIYTINTRIIIIKSSFLLVSLFRFLGGVKSVNSA
jgi:hypothetical protein